MDDFRFDIPLDDIELEKAEDADGDESEAPVERRIIHGYASTAAKDGEEERVLQQGLDLTYLKSHGFINYDHQRHMLLGWPLSVSIDAKGLKFKGELLTGLPMADLMWTTAVALKKSRAPRKLGLSIEGKVIEREGKTIKKARVMNVAVTPHPVNPNATFDVLVKSMSPCDCSGDACCKGDLYRALTAGNATAIAEQTNGDALRQESVDGKLKVTTHKMRKLCRNLKGKAKEACLRMAAQKSLDFDDAVTFLQLTTGRSVGECLSMAEKLACQEAA